MRHYNNKVDVVHISISSKVGRTVTGTDKNVRCFISYGDKFVYDIKGNQVSSNTTVFFPPGTAIYNTDEIKIDGMQRKIASIDEPRNSRTGIVDHIEVNLR